MAARLSCKAVRLYSTCDGTVLFKAVQGWVFRVAVDEPIAMSDEMVIVFTTYITLYVRLRGQAAGELQARQLLYF